MRVARSGNTYGRTEFRNAAAIENCQNLLYMHVQHMFETHARSVLLRDMLRTACKTGLVPQSRLAAGGS